MLPSLKLGRLFGIPVYLHSTLILLPALVLFNMAGFGWPSTLLMMAVTVALFGCVLLHEFGHALMARWFGIPTRDVTLYPVGGVARLERMTEKPAEEVLIALAGPAVNVVIAALLTPLVFALVALFGPHIINEPFTISFDDSLIRWLATFCDCLWVSNIVLVLFNMIPAFPMDGGRVFRAILAHYFGLLRGTEIAVPIGIGVVFMVAFLMVFVPIGIHLVVNGSVGSVNPMPLAIAGVISLVGPMELRALRYREQQKQQSRMSVMAASPPVDSPYTPLPYPDEDEAYAPPRPFSEMKPGFTGYTWDREFGVWIKWQNGRRVAAFLPGSE